MVIGPGGAEAMVAEVEEAGINLRTYWGVDAVPILNAESGIGHGRLAAAFRPGYTPTATVVRTSAEQLPDKYLQLYDAGLASVRDYGTTDYDAARRFPR